MTSEEIRIKATNLTLKHCLKEHRTVYLYNTTKGIPEHLQALKTIKLGEAFTNEDNIIKDPNYQGLYVDYSEFNDYVSLQEQQG